ERSAAGAPLLREEVNNRLLERRLPGRGMVVAVARPRPGVRMLASLAVVQLPQRVSTGGPVAAAVTGAGRRPADRPCDGGFLPIQWPRFVDRADAISAEGGSLLKRGPTGEGRTAPARECKGPNGGNAELDRRHPASQVESGPMHGLLVRCSACSA